MRSNIIKILAAVLSLIMLLVCVISFLNYFKVISLPFPSKLLSKPEISNLPAASESASVEEKSEMPTITISDLPAKDPENPTKPLDVPSSLGGLRNWDNGLSNFYGQVIEKSENYLVLSGGNKTVKVIIPSNVSIKVTSKSELATNPIVTKQKAPEDVSISSIKKDEIISVTGKYDKESITASFIAVYR